MDKVWISYLSDSYNMIDNSHDVTGRCNAMIYILKKAKLACGSVDICYMETWFFIEWN